MRPDLTLDDVQGFLPAPGPDDDKYRRGVVGLAVGSEEYPGAAVLATEAAYRSGCGMARVIAPESVASLVLHTRPEAVVVPGRIDSLVIGSGLPVGSSADVTARLALCELGEAVPRVIDAGALIDTPHIAGPRILTPHAGEVSRLADALQLPGDSPRAWAEALAAHWSVVVVLKGHRPDVFTPAGLAYSLPAGTAWLASAGTGDVLAGLMGTLAALQRRREWSTEELALTAAVAVLVHQEAAHRVSRSAGAGVPGPLLAMDLARELSPVVATIVAREDA